MTGVHTSMLALEANWFAALIALLSAAMWLTIWYRTHQGYALLCALGWCGLCVYWSLLAVSAGPAPVFARAETALVARMVIMGSMALLGAGKMWLLRKAFTQHST